MYQQHYSASSSVESKTKAALKLNDFKHKIRKLRHKRELVDLPMPYNNFENLSHSVSGTQGWAKIAPGSIKIVKRFIPQ